MYYCGLDLHAKTSAFCMVTSRGRKVAEDTRPSRGTINAHIRHLRPNPSCSNGLDKRKMDEKARFASDLRVLSPAADRISDG
jgi:hypothetical protein